MKKIITFLILLMANAFLFAQESSENASILYHWQDESIVGSQCDICGNNVYNEIWGYAKDGREYAIIGTTAGTHIFDITFSNQIFEVGFVEGAVIGPEIIHRDYHDYAGYLYAVCDEGWGESTLQIIDLNNLPFSIDVVYDSHELFSTSHNIFIDTVTAKLYVCSIGYDAFSRGSLAIYSLEDPTNPFLLQSYTSEQVFRPHDIYVRNDTAYLNTENSGLYIYNFQDVTSPKLLGALTDYVAHGQGYNHAGWLNEAGDIYAFADETHGTFVKLVDVSDFSDLKVLSTIDVGSTANSIPHNLMIKDNYLYVSYYYDGLQVFDISDPLEPAKVAYLDTYEGANDDGYKGVWGVYSFLPSGNVLISDMQSGMYLVDVDLPNNTTTGFEEIEKESNNSIQLFPNILTKQKQFIVQFSKTINSPKNLQVFDISGKVLFQQQIPMDQLRKTIQLPNNLPTGYLWIKLSSEQGSYIDKILVVD